MVGKRVQSNKSSHKTATSRPASGPVKKLYYRNVPHMESLVFAPPKVAMRVSRIHKALSSETWGEFQSLMPKEDFLSLLESLCSHGWGELFSIPDAEERFEAEVICPAFVEGDYPDWLQAKQDLWLPGEILKHWGTSEASNFNGDFWIIDVSGEESIVNKLEDLGIGVERRDDLRFY